MQAHVSSPGRLIPDHEIKQEKNDDTLGTITGEGSQELTLPRPLTLRKHAPDPHYKRRNIWIVGDKIIEEAKNAFARKELDDIDPFWTTVNLKWINQNVASVESIAYDVIDSIMEIVALGDGHGKFPHLIIFHVGRTELMYDVRGTSPTAMIDAIVRAVKLINRVLQFGNKTFLQCPMCKPRIIFSSILPRLGRREDTPWTRFLAPRENTRSFVNAAIFGQLVNIPGVQLVSHDNFDADEPQYFKDPNRDAYTPSIKGYTAIFDNWLKTIELMISYDH